MIKKLLINAVFRLTGLISKLEQLDMQARCYLNIGVVKEHMGEFAASIENMDKAIKISKTHDLFELTHLCYISMSMLYNCKKNDAASALRYCNMALEAAKRLPNKVKKICETLITKADILINAGDFASVKQILTKAYKKHTPDENDRASIERSLRVVVKICQTLDELVLTSSVDYAKLKDLYEKLGDGCCHLLNYEKALVYYQKMLECAEANGESGKSLVPIYVSLYQTYKDNKQYDKALEYLWKEFELNQDVPSEAFTTLCSIAEICELQAQPFWTIHDVYQKALRQAGKADDDETRRKLEKIALVRLYKLQQKHKMIVLLENLEEEAKGKGINLAVEASKQEDDEDADSDVVAPLQQNTPDWGEDVDLDALTDSDASDLDETDKPRPQRMTRGNRTLTIKRNNKGETQLHQACIAGNLELARRLIEQGHTVNVRDHAGWLPLHEASNHGFRDIVELLLDKGAAVAINDKGGTSCDGITPLYDACANGFLDVAELLLERGADATVRTDYNETCIEALDKWRKSKKLIEGEQAQYAQLRERLLHTLSKVGICNQPNARPLTNAQARPSSGSSSEGEEDIDLAPRQRRSLPALNRSGGSTSSPRPPSSASKEYRNVMAQLKRPNRAPANYDEPSSSGAKQKRTALLDSNEVDADSWLIDDVGPERKRKRYNSGSIGNRSTAIAPAKENLYDSVLSWETDYQSQLPDAQDAHQVLLDAVNSKQQHRQKQMRKLTLSRSSSMNSNHSSSTTKSKQQSSLLDSGFCRFRSESPSGSNEDSLDGAASSISLRTNPEPDSTTSSALSTGIQLLISPSKHASPIKVQATQMLATTVSFKVKIQEELLLVPIERKKLQDINMRWLAEEAGRRYNK